MTGYDACGFWQRIDTLRGEIQLRDICKEVGVNYKTLLDMRTKERFPKLDITVALAEYFHVSLDYLYTGKQQSSLHTKEAEYVDEHIEAQALIRSIMRDPRLLEALALVIESSEKAMNIS